MPAITCVWRWKAKQTSHWSASMANNRITSSLDSPSVLLFLWLLSLVFCASDLLSIVFMEVMRDTDEVGESETQTEERIIRSTVVRKRCHSSSFSSWSHRLCVSRLPLQQSIRSLSLWVSVRVNRHFAIFRANNWKYLKYFYAFVNSFSHNRIFAKNFCILSLNDSDVKCLDEN